MELKGIIFDVDGTLADTEEFHRQAFNKAFKDFNLDWHWSKQSYHDLLAISGGKERFRICLEQDTELRESIEDVSTFIIDLHQCKSEHYRTMLANGHIQLRPGIKRLIAEARAEGIMLGIATSSSEANFQTLIKQTLDTSAETLFAAIVTSDIVTDKKPSPVVYQCALAEMGLTAENCIAIEDTANGNKAAQFAGLPVVITTHAYTRDNDFTGASLVIDHLGDDNLPINVAQGNALGKSAVDVELLRYFVSQERQQPTEDMAMPAEYTAVNNKSAQSS